MGEARQAHRTGAGMVPGKPRRIVISGYYGFGNLGDEAVLSAMVSHLREALPGAETVAISGDPGYTESTHKIRAVHRSKIRDVIRELDASSLLLSGGGGLLQDVTSSRSLLYYLAIIAAGLCLGKPVMVYAQGIGPVNGRLDRILTRFLLNRVDAITVRDEESIEALRSLGVTRPPIMLTADPVFGLVAGCDGNVGTGGSAGPGAPPRRETGDGPRVGIAPREWKGLKGYKQAIAAAAVRLMRDFGATIVFLPFHRGKDEATCREIMDLMQASITSGSYEGQPGRGEGLSSVHGKVICPAPSSPYEMFEEISGLDLMIGMRLHALIMAACCGVPLVPVSYDPKVDALARRLDVRKAGNVGTVTADAIYELASRVLAGAGGREHLASKTQSLALLARKSAEIAAQVVGRERPTRVDALGLPVDAVDMARATDRVRELAMRKGVAQVVTVNAEIAVASRRDPELLQVIRSADLVTADGAGVVWALDFLGSPVPERVAGYDLMLSVLEASRGWGIGVYLLGAAPGVAEAAKERLEARFPGLKFAGTHHGYFFNDPGGEKEVLDSLRSSGARIFFVALGAPRQEKWIARMRSRGLLPEGVYIGVGGALDVASGLKKRAPLWMQKAGLEWLYRLVTDPSRIGRALSLPRFVLWVVGMRFVRSFFRLFFNVLETKSCRVL
ncbi:MAG TPA: polysaccharide pyruvyl transferase CsaB [Firmicutes bacterium]|nr:polysaccharide pyruvyl transferase CsaB [Bacillota bacterium]